MKNGIVRRIRFFTTTLFLMILLSVCGITSQATEKDDALRAYAAILSKSTITRGDFTLNTANCEFALAYVDNDSVPELFLYHDDSSHVAGYMQMFTYINGTVKRVMCMQGDMKNYLGYHSKTGIFVDNSTWQGSGSYTYIKLSNGIATYLRLSRATDGSNYWVNGGTGVSKTIFDATLKTYVGSVPYTYFTFYNNTAANRSKYLNASSKEGFYQVGSYWKYYKNNSVCTGYTGIVKGTINGVTNWYYVKNGVYTKANGIAQKADGSSNTWFYVKNGVYTRNSGIAKKADGSSSAWFYVLNGVYTRNSGIARKADGSSTTWFYVENGVFQQKSGIAQKADGSSSTWYYVLNGKYTRNSGIAQKADGSRVTWFYVENGVYTRKSGLAKKADGSSTTWFYVLNGVFEKKNGIAKRADGSSSAWYYVLNGKFTRATGITQKADGSSNTWFYVKNGVFTKDTCLAKKADGSSSQLYNVVNGVVSTKTWGPWQTSYSYVASGTDVEVQTYTEYRYQDRLTTTSSSSYLSGWNLDYGSVSYGSYGPYSDWGVDYIAGSDTRQVETQTVYYYSYNLCPYCGAHMHVSSGCYTWAGGCGRSNIGNHWVTMYSTTPYSATYEFHGTGHWAIDTLPGGRWFKVLSTNPTPCAGYRYRDRAKYVTYHFYRWSDWSGWSTGPYYSSSTRNVDYRTVYRYRVRQ